MITCQMVDEEPEGKPGVAPSPLVPIISVTPHSPAGKPYPILEDNLQQLHYIHDSVQQMRDLIVQPFSYQVIGEASRLSASCPSLNDAGSDPDLISSVNSTPTQTLTVAPPASSRSIYHKRGSGEWELFRRNVAVGDGEVARRRSWAALEDLSHGKDSCKAGRQRSAAYDDHSEKRRKRGSLFFRKKKDKVKKTPHQWVTVCYGNSQVCDFCSKSLTNKPSVYCENCTSTAHQSSCKDNIAECKGKINKSNSKNPPIGKPAAKRGSSSNPSGSPSSQVNVDDDHHYHPSHQDNSSYTDEVLAVQYQFPEEALVTVNDLETDPFLGLQDEEPDSWTPTVSKEIVRKLKEKEIKRQEHLYEFILTEKHQCLTLRVMQKVFVEGLKKYLNLGATVDRMFPRINDLVELHLAFLHKLRTRQKDNPVIDNIGSILLEQFGGSAGAALKSVYGEFCSNHRNAIDIYKYYMQSDTRFAEFVKHCQANPLLKKKGIPECILFVTQRLTKYPLLIEPLIKTMKDNKEEQEKLVKALTLVKEILVEVDAQVAEKEKEDRKLEIYNRVEAKSFTTHKGLKFKKSDILDEKRKLRFEGIAMLMQGRGKMQVVLVIVFSDVLCFLLENNHKYSFFTPENKAGVVSLQKLLVREKAGQESRGIYLISSNPAEPEMFELKVHKPKDKQIWIKAIRTAVQECPDDDDYSGNSLSAEERQKQFDLKQRHLRELVELLRQKDKEQALVLEEKLALQLKLLAAAGIENLPERPNYMNLVSNTLDSTRIRQDVHLAVKRVNQLARSLYASAGCVSRSSSSVGEHQSEMFIIPSLPKRAETFGGFDNQVPNARVVVQKKQPSPSSGESPLDSPESHNLQTQSLLSANNSSSMRSLFEDEETCPTLLTEQDHQLAATQLAHHVYTLSCIIYHQMTSIDSLEAEVAILKSHSGDIGKPAYRLNHQLEELRNLQDKLQSEREQWQREKESEMKELQQKRDEIAKLQEQVKHDQVDLVQQRSQLFRKLDVLSSQGVIVNSTLSVSSSSSSDDPSCLPTAPSTDPPKKKNDPSKWKPPTNGKVASLPLNLISTTNQQKVSSAMQIRQQLPLKLASKLGGSCGSSPASPSSSLQQLLPIRLREDASEVRKPMAESPTQLTAHLRTGSSPAMMQNIPNQSLD